MRIRIKECFPKRTKELKELKALRFTLGKECSGGFFWSLTLLSVRPTSVSERVRPDKPPPNFILMGTHGTEQDILRTLPSVPTLTLSAPSLY